MRPVPYGRQSINKDDIKNVVKTLKKNLITTGSEVTKFEKLFSKKVGSKYSVSCSSGTTGLLLAYLAMGIKKDDTIIMPSINFIASLNMAHFINAKIFLTDVDPHTGQMRPEDLVDCIKINKIKKIHTIVIMHNGGFPSDMEGFRKLQKKYKFKIIEDACHALGAKYGSKKNDLVGSCKFSETSVFSFHPLKSITTGEGGMVTTNNLKIYKKLLILRNHGMIRKKSNSKIYNWNYKIVLPGFNFRLTDFQCSLGINQLKRLDRFILKRQAIAKEYINFFLKLEKYVNCPKISENKLSSYHLFILNLKKFKISRDKLITKLFNKNIICQVHYIPVFNFPYYRNMFKKDNFKNANKYFNSSLSIPIYYDLNKKDINYICNQIKKIII